MDDYRDHVEAFLDSGADRHSLGLVYGRRRIGKSTLLEAVANDRGGFYWEATRTESAIQLTRLATRWASVLVSAGWRCRLGRTR